MNVEDCGVGELWKSRRTLEEEECGGLWSRRTMKEDDS
jgi:hypothetical protein